MKDPLAKAAGYRGGYDSVTNEEDLVQKLYDKKDISASTLRRLYFQSFSQKLSGDSSNLKDDGSGEEYEVTGMSKLLESLEESKNSSLSMELSPLFPPRHR